MKKATFTAARLGLLLVIALLVIPGHIFASASPALSQQAKTPPPPILITPFTVFDPAFNYLENGTCGISYSGTSGNYKATIWGDTSGVIRVDKIGVKVYLQRWSGSAWVDVYTGANTELTEASYVYQSHSNLSVTSGYYYRTKSYHWILEGSTSENGYRYSSSILIP
ncbi:hypothetical protein K0T92_21255 [Paenibacillus oenotherae]|uniref:Uncharacterized protein n=1 Tax=Paenibacillus oenotherae TaxID=1435645 RepID=A0ABS7DBU9_9BACL|nr:hypothetical protein [Paenibacillus oenotherae]MBW7477249.1 hypothetical protein [Paenibacillus oenotherae]